MEKLIKKFLKKIKDKFVDKVTQDKCKQIYNEASLQFELAKFLEGKGYIVKIECNIKKLFENKGEKLTKRDIDIVAFKGKKKYAIELKFPVNGRYPEEMYDFIKDIRFMEEIRKKGFNTYCLTIVGDDGFYSNEKLNKHNKAVYDCFRRDDLGIFIDKDIKYTRPTGIDIDKTINVISDYSLKWNDLDDENKKYKYYLIEIK